jgi:hypothetical protein
MKAYVTIKMVFNPDELIDAFCTIAKIDRDYVCTRGKNTTDLDSLTKARRQQR